MPRAYDAAPRLIGTVGLVLVALLGALYAQESSFNFDEFYFLDASKNLALHGKYATFSNGQFRLFDPYLSTGPTVIAPVALAFWLGGPDYVTARLIMVGVFVLLFVLTYGVVAELHGKAAGVAACVFLVCVPHVWYFGLHVLGEVPALVFFLLAVHLMVRTEHSEGRSRPYLLVGLLLGLAALTKLIFFLAVVALACVALMLAAGDRPRSFAVGRGALVGVAVLGAWELVQFLAVGAHQYAELKRDFYSMFTRESGVRGWLSHGVDGVLAEALATAKRNLDVVSNQAGLNPLQSIGAMIIVFARLARDLVWNGTHRVVHLFLGLFLGGYLIWFFFGKHDPWYKLWFPAYLLLGIYVAPVLVAVLVALTNASSVRMKLLQCALAGILVLGLFVFPLARNVDGFLQVHRDKPARRALAMVGAFAQQLRVDSKIGYWGWWRAPDVSFFLPNQFFDISRRRNRETFVPGRDVILATELQRRLNPSSWETQRWFCLEVLVRAGNSVLCRFGDVSRSDLLLPRSPSARLDFAAGLPVREDQLADGFYQPEAGFRWIAGEARFFLGTTVPKGRLRLAFWVPNLLGAHEKNPVSLAVSVDDQLLARYRLTEAGRMTLLTECVTSTLNPGILRVELRTDRFFVPRELGASDDSRELALQLSEIEYQPEERC